MQALYIAKAIGKGKKQIYEKFFIGDELDRLVDATNDGTREGVEAKDLFVLGGVFGLRLNEILRLTFDDMAMLNNAAAFKVRRLKKRKGMVEDLINLSAEEKRILAEIVRRRRRYSGTAKLFNCSDRKVQYMFAYYARKAGLLVGKPRLTFHALRHTCAMQLYAATKDLEFVRSRLGHESYDYLKTYIHLIPEFQREQAAKRRISFA